MRTFVWLLAVGAPLAAEPLFDRQIIYEHEGDAYYHIPVLVTAPGGALLAFGNRRWGSGGDRVPEAHLVLRRSLDLGRTWLPVQDLLREEGKAFHIGSAVVDAASGRVLVFAGGKLLVSTDDGASWAPQPFELRADSHGRRGSTHGSSPGLVLREGPHRGRLVMPARTMRPPYDDLKIPDRQAKCFSCVIYSDDGGRVWQTGEPCLQGTGEAVLAELAGGRLWLNARAYFNDGRRRCAVSDDGGATFGQEAVFEGTVETDQGVNASVLRIPADRLDGRDGLIFVNPATRGGKDPAQPGSIRQRGVARLSLDGGATWPYEREICGVGDAFDYSSLALATDGTIVCLYKTTRTMTGLARWDESCNFAVARFNLEWLRAATPPR